MRWGWACEEAFEPPVRLPVGACVVSRGQVTPRLWLGETGDGTRFLFPPTLSGRTGSDYRPAADATWKTITETTHAATYVYTSTNNGHRHERVSRRTAANVLMH